MDNRTERLRKAYEFKLGKDVASKLSDEQIQLISRYYSSLSEDEQRKIASNIFMGKTNDLSEMINSFIEENEEPPVEKATATATKEPPKSSSVPARKKGENLVDEKIDERILKIIGIDDTFDLSYGTYKTLLKEQLVLIDIGKHKIPLEEKMLLQDEYKRVKDKIEEDRFIAHKKITAKNIGFTSPIKLSKEKFYLTTKAIIPSQEMSTEKDTSEDVKDISQALDELLKSIIGQNKEAKRDAEENTKENEKRKRTKRESELEKPLNKAKILVKKIIQPFQSILDKIFKFIQFTLLGYAFDKLAKWFLDSKNQEKVKVIGRFLKDWWPSLLGAYVLFATPFGKFIRTTLSLLRTLGPKIATFLRANPWVLGATAATAGAITMANESKRMQPLIQKSQTKIDKTLQSKESPWYEKLGASFANQSLNAPGGPKNPIAFPIPGAMYSGGGKVRKNNIIDAKNIAFTEGGGIDDSSGLRINGAGPDTQLIAAQPGEVVISKKAVDKHGSNFFLGLNKNAGGTNIPRMVNNIQLASGGGMVGAGRDTQLASGGGMVGTRRVMQPSTGGLFQQGKRQSYLRKSQQKFLGIPTPFTQKSKNFTESNIQKYNNGGVSKIIGKMPDYMENSSLHKTTYKTSNYSNSNITSSASTPTQQSINTSQNSILTQSGTVREKAMQSAVKNSGDLRNILKYIPFTGGYGDVLKNAENLGTKEIGNQRKMERQIKEILGPQSRTTPPGVPVIASQTRMIVLPPVKSNNKKTDVSFKDETKIPDFQITSGIPYRNLALQSLGIEDLVGV